MGVSLGWGDGGFEGDMGLEPDGPPSPRPSNPPHQPENPAEMTRRMNNRQLRLDSVGLPIAEKPLRQCVNVDRVGWRGFGRPERRDFADQPIAQKLLQYQ